MTCSRCGAEPGAPCVTAAGKVARRPHAGRPASPPPLPAPSGNRAAIDAWIPAELSARAAVLAEAARSLADTIDQDVVPCRDCAKIGMPGTAGLVAEYRRTTDQLAAVLAEEGEDDEQGATVLRLAGGMRS